MDITRKKQTMGLLEQLRGRGKPVGRSEESGMEGSFPGEPMSPEDPGEEPRPGTPEHEEWKRRKQEWDQWIQDNEPADKPAPVTGGY